MTLILGLLVVAATLAYVARPILDAAPPAAPGRAGGHDPAREVRLRQLSELEYDYRMGKLTQEDYLNQRSSLSGR